MSKERHKKRIEKSIAVSQKLIDNIKKSGDFNKVALRVIRDLEQHVVSLRNQLLECSKES